MSVIWTPPKRLYRQPTGRVVIADEWADRVLSASIGGRFYNLATGEFADYAGLDAGVSQGGIVDRTQPGLSGVIEHAEGGSAYLIVAQIRKSPSTATEQILAHDDSNLVSGRHFQFRTKSGNLEFIQFSDNDSLILESISVGSGLAAGDIGTVAAWTNGQSIGVISPDGISQTTVGFTPRFWGAETTDCRWFVRRKGTINDEPGRNDTLVRLVLRDIGSDDDRISVQQNPWQIFQEPISRTIFLPPATEPTAGLIQIRSGIQTKRGYAPASPARSAAESEAPWAWDGLQVLYIGDQSNGQLLPRGTAGNDGPVSRVFTAAGLAAQLPAASAITLEVPSDIGTNDPVSLMVKFRYRHVTGGDYDRLVDTAVGGDKALGFFADSNISVGIDNAFIPQRGNGNNFPDGGGTRAFQSGQIYTVLFTHNPVADHAEIWTNGTKDAEAALGGSSSIPAGTQLFIGKENGDDTDGVEMDLIAAALWRREFSGAEARAITSDPFAPFRRRELLVPVSVGGGTTVNATGVSATGSVGAPTAQFTGSVTTTGVSATGAVGTVTATSTSGETVTATGVSATGAVGTVTASTSDTLTATGVSATGAVGTVTASTSDTLTATGVSATGAVGTVTATSTSGETVIATGVSATGAVGTVNITNSGAVSVTGVTATGAVGVVTIDTSTNATVNVTGVTATGAVGAVATEAPTIQPLTGVSATASVGTVAFVYNSAVSVTGTSAVGAVGNVSFGGWRLIDDSQTPGWSDISSGSAPSWTDVNTAG